MKALTNIGADIPFPANGIFSSFNKWSSIYSLTHMLEKVSGLRFRGLDKKERMKTFF